MSSLFANPHLDPLAEHYTGNSLGQRDIILTDMGIRQALELGLIEITPKPDFSQETQRIQPATLDMRIDRVFGSTRIGDSTDFMKPHPNKLHSMRDSAVQFTETVVCNSLISPNDSSYIAPSANCRSSLHRLTAFMTGTAPVFNCFDTESGKPELKTITELQNFSWNDILIPQNERFVQLFFHVDPFADMRQKPLARFSQGLYRPENQQAIRGSDVRDLEMAVEVKDATTLHWLAERDYFHFSIGDFARMYVRDGLIPFHAAVNAYRVRRLPHALDFTKRKEYEKNLLEPIDITKGYTLKAGELLVIETQEQVRLGPHIGMQVVQNAVTHSAGGLPFTHLDNSTLSQSGLHTFVANAHKHKTKNSLGGWIDPGYAGMMSCLVMTPGRTVKPGDEIGYCKVYFSPKPVGIPYGSQALGSQYQGADKLQLAKK